MDNHESLTGRIRVPSTVFAQLKALRESGTINMYSEIHVAVDHLEFVEARQWIESHPEMYVTGFRNGFAPTDPDTVKAIDPDTLRASIPDEPPTPTRTDANTSTEQQLLEHLQSVRRFSTRAETYYTEGVWRTTTPLNEEEAGLADMFDVSIDCQPQMCYRNALLTAATFAASHDVTYVEGYAKPSVFALPVEHAWIELNKKVIELTFPKGPEPNTAAAYLGIEFPVEDVKTKVFDEEITEPLVD